MNFCTDKEVPMLEWRSCPSKRDREVPYGHVVEVELHDELGYEFQASRLVRTRSHTVFRATTAQLVERLLGGAPEREGRMRNAVEEILKISADHPLIGLALLIFVGVPLL